MQTSVSRLSMFDQFLDQAFLYIEILKTRVFDRTVDDNVLIQIDASSRETIQNEENIYVAVHTAMVKIIKNIESVIANHYNKTQVKDFILLLCALFDELAISEFQNSEWRNYLIEKTIFMTSVAGEKVIENINKHISTHSAKDNEMGVIYYRTICFGFKGMYYDDTRKILILKNKLFYIVKDNYNLPALDYIEHLSSNMYLFMVRSENAPKYINYSNVYSYIILSFILFILLIFIYVIFIHIKFKLSKIIE